MLVRVRIYLGVLTVRASFVRDRVPCSSIAVRIPVYAPWRFTHQVQAAVGRIIGHCILNIWLAHVKHTCTKYWWTTS